MSRRTNLLVALLLAIPPIAAAQQPDSAQQPNSKTPEDAFSTRELIAWSQLQKPQPAPQHRWGDRHSPPKPSSSETIPDWCGF